MAVGHSTVGQAALAGKELLVHQWLWSGFYVWEWGVGVEEVRKFRGPSMKTERG